MPDEETGILKIWSPGLFTPYRKWDKVLVFCRAALLGFGTASPRYTILFAGGFPSHAHLSLQDDDTGCAEEGGDDDSSDCGDPSNTGGSSDTNASLERQSMLDDGLGGMLTARAVEVSDDDLPIASSASRVQTR